MKLSFFCLRRKDFRLLLDRRINGLVCYRFIALSSYINYNQKSCVSFGCSCERIKNNLHLTELFENGEG